MSALIEGARVALIDRSGLPSWLARWQTVTIEKIGVAFVRVRPPGDRQADHAFWLHPARLGRVVEECRGADAPFAAEPRTAKGSCAGEPLTESDVEKIVSDLARRGLVTLTSEGNVERLTALGQAALDAHGATVQ